MNVERIDTSKIDEEMKKRATAVEKMVEHRAAPTELPGWWESYFGTLFLYGFPAAVAVAVTALAPAMSIIETLVPSGGVVIISVYGHIMLFIQRRSSRRLAGAHGELWRELQSAISHYRKAIATLNREADGLSDLDADLDAPTREALIGLLGAERKRLIAEGERLFREGFDEPFAPCLEALDDMGALRSVHAVRNEHRDVLLTAYARRLMKAGYLDLADDLLIARYSDPALTATYAQSETDDIEARFAALEAADRSKL